MPGEIVLISIVAMFIGYKLLSQFLGIWSKDGEKSRGESRREARRIRKEHRNPVPPQEADDLKQRADEMLRRLQTLEEIIASEPRSQRS